MSKLPAKSATAAPKLLQIPLLANSVSRFIDADAKWPIEGHPGAQLAPLALGKLFTGLRIQL
jgi:hypothetical protein